MKVILRILVSCVPICLAMLLWTCSDGRIKRINDVVDIENQEGHFNLILDRDTEYEWKFFDVDSVAVCPKGLQLLVYGRAEMGSEKKWFLVGGGERELKKGFGDWYDREFRKYRLDEVDRDRQLYKTLVSAEELWNNN